MFLPNASDRMKFAKSNDGLWTPTDFESRPGTDALLLSSATDAAIPVGRLGDLSLQPGFYVYVGSALGSGGVRARLACAATALEYHHLRLHMAIVEVWFTYDRKSREHTWTRYFAEMRGASVPMTEFGASDRKYESHLFFFRKG